MQKDKKLTFTKLKYIGHELQSMSLIVAVALAIRVFFVELFYVPTGSMKGTILEGDYILSTKYDYGYSIYSIPFHPDIFRGRVFNQLPKRGDIVIMRPPHNMEERYIKRLIGFPGEKIEIRNDLIYINDVPIDRSEVGTYISEDNIEYTKFREVLPNNVTHYSYKLKNKSSHYSADCADYGPKIIERGKYFFLGDNRDNSGDSRYQLGTVEARNFIAKGRLVLFSTKLPLWNSASGLTDQLFRFGEWFYSIRFNRIFNSLYVKKG